MPFRANKSTPALRDVLNVLAGTFSRGSEGSYLTSPSTVGWAGNDIRRVDYRNGVLYEGARTNDAPGQNLSSGTWVAGFGTPTVTANQPAPDGTNTADRVQLVANDTTVYDGGSPSVSSVYRTASSWKRATTGTLISQGLVGTPNASVIASLDTTWRRVAHTRLYTGNGYYVMVDCRDWTASGGIAAHSEDLYLWGHQNELGAFASSLIRTGGATRAADIHNFAVGQYSASLLSIGAVLDFWPVFSSVECVLGGTTHLLLYRDANNSLRLRGTGGQCLVELVCGGSVVASRVVSFDANTKLTIAFSPSNGSLIVSGAFTGSGSASGAGAAWSSGTIAVGSDGAGNNSAFGVIA